MTGPEGPRIRLITLGPMGRVALGLALLIAGASALIIGATLVVAFLAVAAAGTLVGGAILAWRRLTGRSARDHRIALDPSLEVHAPPPPGGRLPRASREESVEQRPEIDDR